MNATELRELLSEAGVTQRAAARELQINERTMRRYAAGEPIPRVVELALQQVFGEPNEPKKSRRTS